MSRMRTLPSGEMIDLDRLISCGTEPGELYEGFDDDLQPVGGWTSRPRFSKEDQLRIAELMIEHWQAFAEKVKQS